MVYGSSIPPDMVAVVQRQQLYTREARHELFWWSLEPLAYPDEKSLGGSNPDLRRSRLCASSSARHPVRGISVRLHNTHAYTFSCNASWMAATAVLRAMSADDSKSVHPFFQRTTGQLILAGRTG